MQILPRRGNAALWTTVNPVLGQGEEGLELDTGLKKRGDGTSTWSELPYIPSTLAQLDARYPGGGGSGGGITSVVSDTSPELGGNLNLNGHTVGVATASDLSTLHVDGSVLTLSNGKALEHDFGFCQSELASPTWWTTSQVTSIVQGIAATGARRVRVAAWWSDFNTARGVYSWTALDYLMNQCTAAGVIPLVCITSSAGATPFSGATTTDYANACGALAARYGAQGTGQLSYYEIWNEQNQSLLAEPFTFGAAAYAAILIAASTAIKAADSKAFVITGGLQSTLTGGGTALSPSDFVTGLYANSAKGHFDAIGFHWYSYASDYTTWQESTPTQIFYEQLTAVRAVMTTNTDTSPIWITECGYPQSATGITSAEQRSRWLAEQLEMIYQLPYVPVFFVYNYHDDSASPSPDNGYGIVDFTGDILNPAYTMLASINGVVPAVTPAGSISSLQLALTSGAGGVSQGLLVAADGTLSIGPTKENHYLTYNTTTNTWPTRPSDSLPVIWVGGAAPTNAPSSGMQPGDIWLPSSGDGTPLGATLEALQGISPNTGLVPYFTSSTTAGVLILSADTTLGGQSPSNTYLSTQEAVKYYIDHVVTSAPTVSYTLALTDAGTLIEMNNPLANTVTIPVSTSLSKAFDLNITIELCQIGVGQTQVVAASGVTLLSAGSKTKLNTQYSGAFLRQRALDTWVLTGDLTS